MTWITTSIEYTDLKQSLKKYTSNHGNYYFGAAIQPCQFLKGLPHSGQEKKKTERFWLASSVGNCLDFNLIEKDG